MVEAGERRVRAVGPEPRSWRRRTANPIPGPRRNVAEQRPPERRACAHALAVAVPCRPADRGARVILRAHITSSPLLRVRCLQGTCVLRRGRRPFANASGFHVGGTRLALESC